MTTLGGMAGASVRRVQGEGQQPGSGNEEQVGHLPCLVSSRPRRSSVWEWEWGAAKAEAGK